MNTNAPRKYFALLLCAIILAGYFLPAVHMHFSVLMIERTASFGLADFFSSDSTAPFNIDLTDTDFSTLFADSDVVAEVGLRVAASVGAYMAALLIILMVLVLAVVGRFGRGRAVLCGVALALYALSGWVMLTVPPLANEVLENTIRNLLGFFALFINATDMIALTLGGGYWLTVTGLAGLLITEMVFMGKKGAGR